MKFFNKLAILALSIVGMQNGAFASYASSYDDIVDARAVYRETQNPEDAAAVIEYYNQASPADKAKFDADLAERGSNIGHYYKLAGLTPPAGSAAAAAAARPSIASAKGSLDTKHTTDRPTYAASAAGTSYAPSAAGSAVPSAGRLALPKPPVPTAAEIAAVKARVAKLGEDLTTVGGKYQIPNPDDEQEFVREASKLNRWIASNQADIKDEPILRATMVKFRSMMNQRAADRARSAS